jgi:alpha-D-ribose 1-methylphosphonate 5-triphosphate synthase subunit PhnH
VIALANSVSTGGRLSIAGPGVASVAELAVTGLPADFTAQWAANRAAFPLGVDILFADAHSLVGLPRSARIIAEGR